MIIKPIKTRILKPPQNNLLEVIEKSIKKLPEKSILVITSKVVSIWQGRCVPMSSNLKKDDLVIKEADFYLPRSFVPGAWCMHTLKDNLFVPSAGTGLQNILELMFSGADSGKIQGTRK